MHLAEILSQIAPPATGEVVAEYRGDGIPTIKEAADKVDTLQRIQARVETDAAYWSYGGQISYWRCVRDLVNAANLVGPENLPDIPLPENGKVVMDTMRRMEDFGAAVLKQSRLRVGEPV